MKSFFKPLSKRDARIVAVIIGLALLYLVYSLLKSVFAGSSFDDVRSDILLILFFGIIEWGMITIAFSKPKEGEEELTEEAKYEDRPADLRDEAEKLADFYEQADGASKDSGK